MDIRWEIARVEDNGEDVLVNYICDEVEVNHVVRLHLGNVNLDEDLESMIQSHVPANWFEQRIKAARPLSPAAAKRKQVLKKLVGRAGTLTFN